MGLMRKMASASTAGMISWNNPKEKQANAAAKNARAGKKAAKAAAERDLAEARLLDAQRRAIEEGRA